MKKKQYHVSEPRLRTLVLNSGLVQVEIHTRDGDPDKLLHRCPVCSGPLERVKNQTIYGGEVTLEFRCILCGYWTGKKKEDTNIICLSSKITGIFEQMVCDIIFCDDREQSKEIQTNTMCIVNEKKV